MAAGSFGVRRHAARGHGVFVPDRRRAQRRGRSRPDKFGGKLLSDVITTIRGPDGTSSTNREGDFRPGDEGCGRAPTAPTTANHITVDRYHVTFIRADGRNIPGVDVPYPFDGAFTTTVGSEASTGVHDRPQHRQRLEAPLLALGTNGVIISTLAEVTFYGHDQTGREGRPLRASASISAIPGSQVAG